MRHLSRSGLARAREAADDFAAIAPVCRGNEFNRFAVGEIGRAREMEYWGFFANAEELGFFGGGDGGFGDFVGGVNLDAIVREERLVERILRIQFVVQVRAKANRNVSGLDAKRNRIGEANALEEECLLLGRKAKGVGDVGRGSDAFEGEDTGARLGTADTHFLAEGKNLAKILFELGARDESAFSALAVCDTEMTERFEGLASRHAADAHTLGNFLFGGDGLANPEGAGTDLLQERLLNLVVERDGALPVEDDAVHEELLQLYRRLDKYSDSAAMSSGIWRGRKSDEARRE